MAKGLRVMCRVGLMPCSNIACAESEDGTTPFMVGGSSVPALSVPASPCLDSLGPSFYALRCPPRVCPRFFCADVQRMQAAKLLQPSVSEGALATGASATVPRVEATGGAACGGERGRAGHDAGVVH